MFINILLFGDDRLNIIKILYDIYYDKVLNLKYLKVFNYVIYSIL